MMLFINLSSEESWKRVTELLVDVAHHGEVTGYGVPALIMAAKNDLHHNSHASHDSARICQDMGILPPESISIKSGDYKNIFRKIGRPHLSIPETDAGRSSKQYDRLINCSLVFVSVGAAIAIVGLPAYRVYAARKSTSG
ncbi:hypothetical protein Droror1_Dr00001961 [Drosera rotundifolia]